MWSLWSPTFGSALTHVLVILTAFFNIANTGADSAMINNLPLFAKYFEDLSLDAGLLGLNSAITSVGCIIGSPLAGPLLDRLGRVRGMMIGSVTSMIGVLIAGLSPNEAGLVVGRFILGVSVIISATACPLWLVEIAAPAKRVLLMGILMALAALSAAVYNALVLALYDYGTTWAWKGYMLGELICPLVGLMLCFCVPESPRWLIYKGRNDEGLELLASLHGNGDPNSDIVQLEFDEIRGFIDLEITTQGGWKSLVSPTGNRKRFSIAILINIFYQMCGSSGLLYFMSTLLGILNITTIKTIVGINVGLSGWNMVAMVLGGSIIDRLGRKPVLVWSTSIMALCMIVIGVLHNRLNVNPTLGLSVGAVVMIFIFQFVASASWVVLAYSYPNEILSFQQRAKGAALAQSVGYGFGFIWLYCFPIALENINWKYFILNGCWNMGFAAAIQFFFVETNGRTLEEIDELFGQVIASDEVNEVKSHGQEGLVTVSQKKILIEAGEDQTPRT